jgi:nucleoid-associated protein YgaU
VAAATPLPGIAPEPAGEATPVTPPEPEPAAAVVESAPLAPEVEVAPEPEAAEVVEPVPDPELKPEVEPVAEVTEPVAEPVAEPVVVAVAAPAPALDVPEPAAAAVDTPVEQTAAAESGETVAPPRIAGTAIVRADGVEVTTTEAPRPRQVSLASISYADDGEVMLAGLGTAGARLRAYVDDGFAEEGTVGTDGRWSLELGDVDVGIYQLRIDQIDGAGKVASRVETPFQRDLPRGPLPRPEAGDRPTQVTVQPGANLWTLARVHYGAGVLYSQIFLANKELIRDPHLIYPGQIFDLPGAEDNR